jgi:transposase
MEWAKTVHFEHQAHEILVAELIRDVEVQRERVKRFDEAIDAIIPTLPEESRAVIAALQTMRGVAQLSAATVVLEAGELTRFSHPRELMGTAGSSRGNTRAAARCVEEGSPRPATRIFGACSSSRRGVTVSVHGSVVRSRLATRTRAWR